MEYTLEERAKRIIEDCLVATADDPIIIFQDIANKDYIRIHGPEHHILDGACMLTAFNNAGGKIELAEMLEKLMCEGLRMPAGACGLWGVCGASSSVGVALWLIDRTREAEATVLWGTRMGATSKAINRMGEIGGPRCCKRDAFISMAEAVKYINENFDVKLPETNVKCGFFGRNEQCIKSRCPYHPEVI